MATRKSFAWLGQFKVLQTHLIQNSGRNSSGMHGISPSFKMCKTDFHSSSSPPCRFVVHGLKEEATKTCQCIKWPSTVDSLHRFPETFVKRFSIKNCLNEKITLKISVPHLSISSMVWGNSPLRWFSISWTLETQQNTVGEIKDRYRSKILPQSDLRSWCVMLLRVASCCFHLHFSSGSLRA